MKIDLAALQTFVPVPPGDYTVLISDAILSGQRLLLNFELPNGFTFLKKYELSSEAQNHENSKYSLSLILLCFFSKDEIRSVAKKDLPSLFYRKKLKLKISYFENKLALTNIRNTHEC